MNKAEESTYLEELGFRLEKQEGECRYLRPTTEVSTEHWMLAWHLFAGKVMMVPPTEDELPGSTPDRRDHLIEDLAADLLTKALLAQASDIHLEPGRDRLRVRFRLDGHLVAQPDVASEKKDHLTAHIKIRAGMDIAEKRRAQDGRIRFHHRGQDVDLRVSTLPTKHGEKIVLRILDKSGISLDLNKLGLPPDTLKTVRRVIHAPRGLNLVTGPTGSGKTTTLYSCLADIQSESLNIVTVEDPIEYELEGINQTQVKPEIGVTFSSVLRTLLRQDPNVIMVGEIRDEETAALSVRAALTGHLVLSTLHTNDALGAVARLNEMGVPSHLLSACLNLVIAQRLVRRLCVSCRRPNPLSGPVNREKQLARFKPGDCPECARTGYRGRTGIFEVLTVEETIRNLIAAGADRVSLEKAARATGMQPLAEQVMDLVCKGITSMEEAVKEVGE